MNLLKRVAFVLIVAAILLSACQTPATVAPKPTDVPLPTAAPKATDVAKPTEAPKPTEVVKPTVDVNAPVAGGKVIIGTDQEPGTLNPLLATSSVDDWVQRLTIEGLVMVDADGKYAPVLAEALPAISADGLTVTYKLKKGVKFSNGDPFTCADVVFTRDAIISPQAGGSTAGYSDIDKIDCKDDTTAVITFSKVFAPYLSLFSYIIPKSVGKFEDLEKWDFNRNPVGTGPWMVKEWKSGDSITFVKNPNYRDPGKPYLDQVIVRIVPSFEAAMQQLGTGELNVLWNLIETDLSTIDSMKDQGVGYAAAVTGENELLLLNFADPKQSMVEDPAKNPHPILGDLKVRQAIQFAIDKEEIVSQILDGKVKVGTTVLPVGQFACPQDPSKYDMDQAKKLLDEAGWKVGSDGIRAKNGVRLSLKITSTAGNKTRENTEQVLVEKLKEAGIELVIENLPSDTLFNSRKEGKFDILLYTTGPGIDPDGHLYSNYHSASIPTKKNEGSGKNYSRWINPEVDMLIDDGASIADVAKRQEIYCTVAKDINTDLPRIFLYERLLISGYRTNLQNFVVSPGASDLSWDSANWWIKK